MDVAGIRLSRGPVRSDSSQADSKDPEERYPPTAHRTAPCGFFALLAALLGENPARLYFFEEIDNGIHPARLHLLIDLIERQTAKGRVQVVSTTHSPELLSMGNDDTFRNMSVVCRLEDSEDAIIRTVSDLPNAKKLREDSRIGPTSGTGGWMETALAFTEGDGGR